MNILSTKIRNVSLAGALAILSFSTPQVKADDTIKIGV